ncbi:RNA recognition motif domain-containing protein [Mucilaginibacter lacusdianchii]|uniref:RNA recognition motif domain-containing protein n=1 Tax=Mucilaginibacter lacusdianchii TaxID=2684211 RepID=UPI00131DB976|nr:RNA-binding protein [Mucilaginibacter sp. JXJ CY 39]
MTKLFTVGFSRDTDEVQLDELFSQHGLVKTLTIVRDQQTGESKGYAFVQMLDEAGGERAIKGLDGLRINGRTLSVRYAAQPHQSGAQFSKPSTPNASPKQVNAPRSKRPRVRRK